MKKLLLAAIVFLGAASANAQTTVCIDFVNFCDGFELQINPGVGVSGSWASYDCAGTRSPMTVTRPRGDGQWLSTCSADAGCEAAIALGRELWVWLFDFASMTGDLIAIDNGVPTFVQDDTPIALSPGACPFNPQAKAPSTSAAGQ